MDIFTKNKRSAIMKAVRDRDSKIEINFRRQIWAAGFRYRKNCPNFHGKPDLVFNGRKVVIFIDSCFWHCCKKHGTAPKSHALFWKRKFERNKERDKEVNRYYGKIGWCNLRFWEHDLKKNSEKCVKIATTILISRIIKG